jgi:spore maturation protein CgeB
MPDYASTLPITVAGGFRGTDVGGSLAAALTELKLAHSEVDFRAAFGAGLWQSLRFRWDRMPQHLTRFSNALVQHCQERKTRTLITTGIFPMTPSAARQLQEAGVNILNFLTDDPWNPAFANRYFLPGLRYYHTVFTPRHANVVQLQATGVPRLQYLPFGYDPRFFYPESAAESAVDLLFVGGCDRDRAPLLQPLAKAGLQLALYGGGWDKYPQFRPHSLGLTGPDALRAQTASAKVSLILVRRANRDGHVMRSFEAAACGGCLLVERTADHEAIFGPDGEAVRYFSHDHDILPALQALLATPAERARMRVAVLARMQGQRYLDRVQTILHACTQPSF